jgi:hypothetical protein
MSRDPRYVPVRDVVQCEQCGESLDVRALGVGREVRGYYVNRAQGGANVITLVQRLDRWLCRGCLAARKAGHVWDQPSLFDDA